MERTRSVQIELGGQRIRIRTDADPAYLGELARCVNGQIDELRAGRDGGPGLRANPAALAAMAALRIADELFRERQERLGLRAQVRMRAERILKYLDTIAAGDADGGK